MDLAESLRKMDVPSLHGSAFILSGGFRSTKKRSADAEGQCILKGASTRHCLGPSVEVILFHLV